MAEGDHPQTCFREWMDLQEQEHSELILALNIDQQGGKRDDYSHRLIEKSIEHFQEYVDNRARFAAGGNEVSSFFAPRWSSAQVISMLWIAGCRPSMFIRLLYALIGRSIEAQLEEYLQGKRTGNLGEVSAMQMNSINSLQSKIFKEEDKLSAKLVGLQEDLADLRIAIIAAEAHSWREGNRDADEALDEHARSTLSLMVEADKLRLNSLKEVIGILTPFQAVEFLAACKKLHLCIHGWCRRRDDQHRKE